MPSFFSGGLIQGSTVTYNDSLVIQAGATERFEATAGGIAFQSPGSLDGILSTAGGGNENVELTATGTILIAGAVGSGGGPVGENRGPLKNLTIHSGTTINFGSDVTLTGNLIIEQGANVTFGGAVNVTGNVTIQQAGSVTFTGAVTVGGNLTIGNASDLTKVASVTFNNPVNVTGTIGIYANGNITVNSAFNQTAASAGTVLRTNAAVIYALGSSVNLTGSGYANTLFIDKATTVTFSPERVSALCALPSSGCTLS